MQAEPDYSQLTDALARISCDESAAQYHGALCGALCVQEPVRIDLVALLGGEGSDTQALKALGELRDHAVHDLTDSDMGFNLLLPDDDTPLPKRAQALAQWCEGFLYGLASHKKLDFKAFTEDAREVLRDLTQFTKASAGEDDSELEENAYAELVEYVRVGAQLIFMELRRSPTPDPQKSKTVH